MELKAGAVYKVGELPAGLPPGADGTFLIVRKTSAGLYAALACGSGGELPLAPGLAVFPDLAFAFPGKAFEKEVCAPPAQSVETALRRLAVDAALWCLESRTAVSSRIPASGKSVDGAELASMIEASLDMWLTAGRFHDSFEHELAQLFGARRVLAVNSGSSANLLAVAALTSHKLGKRRLLPGDEVITVAAAFPTTVAPIVQHGLVPVFADVEPNSCNVRLQQLEQCLGPRSKAVFLAHTLGNPFDAKAVAAFCKKHSLWFIEDNCDALGSAIYGKPTGSFGHLATLSFYPAHHITTGEGGALVVNEPELADLALSLRDWGRDCKCPPGRDGICGERFSKRLGRLPQGYDHKYTYSHLGYNLKMTDWQAAIGLAQLGKLASFSARRKSNFKALDRALGAYGRHLLLPASLPGADPAWFGYPLTVRPDAPFKREQLTGFLERRDIGTRTLFGGNMLRQPAFTDDAVKLRILDGPVQESSALQDADYARLPGTETVMNGAFWIGLWPGLGAEHMEAISGTFREFFGKLPR